MKALVKTAKGPGNLELRDIPVPEIGKDDILLEVKAASICGSDVRIKNLGNSESLFPPVVIGHEFSGVVCRVGENVTDYKVGDRIVSDNTGGVCGKCEFCAQGQFLLCEGRKTIGYTLDGGFTKYVKISGELLRKDPFSLFYIPDNVTFEEASLMDPICNAYKALIQETKFIAGNDVIIFGLGPIGLIAVQLAKIAGAARIIAVNRSYNEERFKIARDFGATCVVCSAREDTVSKIREHLCGGKADVIVDCAGSNDVFKMMPEVLRRGGDFVKVGYDNRPLDISLDSYVNKVFQIHGHMGYDYISWKNCLKLLEAGIINVKPLITHRFPLSKWEEAFETVESRRGIKVFLYSDDED